MKFGALWIGPISAVETTVWKSFIYYGHELHIFLYDQKIKVPSGVIKEDANDIVKENLIFTSPGPKNQQNNFSAFADYFRYSLIKETGLAWTDSDALCNSDFFTRKKYFFAADRSDGFVANGTLVIPKDSQLINHLISEAEKFLGQDNSNLPWATLGPRLLTPAIQKFGLQRYVMPTEYLHPIGFHETDMFFRAKYKNDVIERSKDSASIHLWNSILKNRKINKNKFQPNCFMDYAQRKFADIK